MKIEKTKQGIYIASNDPIVDLSKEIDDKYTQIKRPRGPFGIFGKKGTIYAPNDYAPEKRMSGLTAVAGGVALLLAGCSALPTPDFKKNDVCIEQNAWGEDLETSQTRIEVKDNGKKAFVADYTEGKEMNATARQYVDMPGVFKGYVSLIGDSKSVKHGNDENSFGGDFDFKTKDNLVIGGTLERTLNQGLEDLYLGYEDNSLVTKAGIAVLNDNTILQSMLAKSFGDKTGYIFSVGGLYDTDNEKRQLTLNHRKFTEKGKGFGYDFWSKIDSKGNSVTKAKIALSGSNIGKFLGVNGFKGNGLNELKLINNPLERLSPDLYSGDTVIVGKYFGKKDAKDTGSLAIYQNIGDLGIIKDINLGLGTGFDKDVTPSVCFNLGPVGVYYESTMKQGSKPNHMISAWVSASDIYKALVGGK